MRSASTSSSLGGAAAITARARSRARENFRTLHTRRIDAPGHVPIARRTSPRLGRLAASRRMSRSIVSSPTLRLSRLISSSRSASSSFWRARSAFSAPSRKRSRQPSTSATFSPWRRAAWSGRGLSLEQADYQGCTTPGRSNAALLPAVDPLPFATSQVIRPCTIGGSISKRSRIK
jgi:hypothetical protein